MKYLRLLLNLGIALIGVRVIWDGITEFDHATTIFPFLRGLFWMLIGIVCVARGSAAISDEGDDDEADD